ncbi:MAG: histone-like protein [Nanoarchaeota archaeon]
MPLIIKSNIKKVVKELQGKNEEVSSVAEEVETALERKVEKILVDGIERAKANKRRTLQGRDL